MYLPRRDCGWSAADRFCQDKGYRHADDFDVDEGRIRSETWLGAICRHDGGYDCLVYREILCEK